MPPSLREVSRRVSRKRRDGGSSVGADALGGPKSAKREESLAGVGVLDDPPHFFTPSFFFPL